jgi:hypothetical protein
VGLNGTDYFVIRDITDINHPFTVSSLGSLVDYAAQFVNATELSDRDGILGLVRMPLSGLPRTVVAACGGTLFAWSPDGRAAAYVASSPDPKIGELHIVSAGRDVVVDSVPSPFPFGATGCESRGCSDNWFFRIHYSQDGRYVSLVELPGPGLRIWTSSGKLLKSVESSSATMSVWSGNALYWRDDKGVEMWRDGSQSLVLPGVSWIRPHASPAGGQIVYETRDANYSTAHVFLLDTTTGKTKAIAESRSEPAFLDANDIWYMGERACAASDPCVVGPTIATRPYIYDLTAGTESQSIISIVWDVWPHPA